jgi:hypothetical protein
MGGFGINAYNSVSVVCELDTILLTKSNRFFLNRYFANTNLSSGDDTGRKISRFLRERSGKARRFSGGMKATSYF